MTEQRSKTEGGGGADHALTLPPLEPMPTQRVETRWRRIVTPIPAPESLPAIERLRSVEPRSMAGMPPILWDQAEGFLVRDGCGNQWIDLTSGIVMANAGHAHPRILEAIHRAVEEKLLFTYGFPSRRRLALLEKLQELSPIPDSKAILYSAGTEATECAMGLMRRHGRGRSPDKVGILSFRDSFHGRTLAASLAAGTPQAGDFTDAPWPPVWPPVLPRRETGSSASRSGTTSFRTPSARATRGETADMSRVTARTLPSASSIWKSEVSGPSTSPASSQSRFPAGPPGRFPPTSPQPWPHGRASTTS